MNTSMIKLQSAMLVTLILMASCGPSPTSSNPAPTPTPDASASAKVADLDKRLTSLEQQIAKLSQQVGVNSGSSSATLSPSLDPASVKDFTIQPSTVEVQVGDEATLDQAALTLTNDQASNTKSFNLFSYSVIDPSIASVDSNGKIKGIKEGATVVSMKIGSVTKTFGVLVKAATPSPSPTPTATASPSPTATPTASSSSQFSSLTAAPATYSIKVGSTDFISSLVVILAATGEPATITNRANVTFTSNDTSIATVDAGGVILGKAVGNTTITVNYAGVSTTVTVNIISNDASSSS